MSKRKILTMALAICMVAILAVGGTLAYLTDTDQQTNTFTAGQIYIELDETKITGTDDNGFPEYSDDERTSHPQEYKLRPGLVVEKDPKITLLEKSEDAYMGAIITITCPTANVKDEYGNLVYVDENGEEIEITEETDLTKYQVKQKGLYDLIGVENSDNIDITKQFKNTAGEMESIVTGGLLDYASTQKTNWNGLSMVYDNDKCVIYQVPDKTNNQWKLYVFLKGVYQRDNDEVDADGNVIAGDDDNEEFLFTALNIPAEYNSNEMAVLANLQIDINAYAVQIEGFQTETGTDGTDAFKALTTAFPDDWKF